MKVLSVNNNLRIEIEISPRDNLRSAKVTVAVKPLNHYIKTLVCVVDALKEFFRAAGYTIDRFVLQSDSTEVKVVLHYLRSSDMRLESVDQGQENIANAEGG